MSQTFIKTAISDEDYVICLLSFLKVISTDKKEMLERILEQTDEERDTILDVLSIYKCYILPSETNMKVLVMRVANAQIM